jgi:putative transcriptional regulator
MRKELAIARENIGITQARMAEILGISRSFYGLIENGMRNPDYGLAKRIAKILKVSPNSIFFDLDGFKTKQRREDSYPKHKPVKEVMNCSLTINHVKRCKCQSEALLVTSRKERIRKNSVT